MENLFPFFHWTNLLIIPGLLVGYTVHELGHALAAYYLGDNSQVEQGRITLNPMVHISWLGFVAFLLFGLGWPKPLRVNPQGFKRGYLDLCLVALSGPAASLTCGLASLLLTLAIAAGLVYASGVATDQVFPYVFRIWTNLPENLNLQAVSIAFTGYMGLASLSLAFVSLLPLPGLDGFTAIVSLLAFLRKRNHRVQRHQPEPIVADRPVTLLRQQQRRNNAADIHFKVGTDYHEAQQYDDAIARYQQAIRSDAHFGPAYVNLGLAHLAKGSRQKAIQAFRGAAQYADDQKSQGEAWQQLHQLSEINPIDQKAAQESMNIMGATPWTDTKPRPNWFNLGLSGFLLFLGALFLYGYLVTQLIKLLKA